MFLNEKKLMQISMNSTVQLAISREEGDGIANALFLTDAALSTTLEKLACSSHFIVASDPFLNTARRRNGTKSLPDARALHRWRVHEIIAERKGRIFSLR